MSALCKAMSCQGTPRPPAEDRTGVCRRCREVTEARLESLTALYGDLLRPTRVGAPSRRSEGSERPTALPDGALEARAGIRRELTRWSVSNAYVIRATPDAHDIASQVRHARGLLARYLSTDLGPILVDGIDDVWGQGWRAAYPARPVGHVIGDCPCARVGDPEQPCGGPVRTTDSEIRTTGYAQCQKCDASAHLDWWRANLPLGHADWMLMTDLRWHIVVMIGVRVPVATVHSWVHRGHLATGADPRGRITYEVAPALALARRAANRLAKVGIRA